ncbi:MAG TPA: hypothetical protein VHT24_11180 [Pseudacidobacterium sp.]|jgi:hypothetical protein|nr:hypothetical protein [Pseudacidobacterium sp.]
MTGRFDTTTQKIGMLALAFTIFLVATLAGFAALAVAVILIGAASPFLVQALDMPSRPWWLLPTSLTAALLAALGVVVAIHQVSAEWWILPFVLFAVISGTSILSNMTKHRCALCHRRLGPHAITFGCPRCGLEVCDDSCWSFEHRRCRMCEENHVPILPSQSQWWDRYLGPRVQQGRCQLCMASPEQSDLRGCGHCHRPQCRDCWDQNNGECSRCGWVMPNLPEPLKTFAVHIPAQMEN